MIWFLALLATAPADPPVEPPRAALTPPAAGTASAIRLRPDDRLHLLGGWLAAGSGYAAGVEAGLSEGDRRLAGGGLVLTAGLTKELFDAIVQRESFSVRDLAATALGGALFVGVSILAAR